MTTHNRMDIASTEITLGGKSFKVYQPTQRRKRLIRGMVVNLYEKYQHILRSDGSVDPKAPKGDLFLVTNEMLDVVLTALDPRPETWEWVEDNATDQEIPDAFSECLRMMNSDPTQGESRPRQRSRGKRKKKRKAGSTTSSLKEQVCPG